VDADELARIAATLVAAVAEAKARAGEYGIDSEFREIVRHAREMHGLLLEAMRANEPLATAYLRGLSDAAVNSIEHLESLAPLPDGMMQ
jgi:chorismate mutase